MDTQNIGIENLKDGLKFPLAVAMAVDRAKDDGKFGLDDLQYLVGPGMALPGFLKGFAQFLPELKDLDDAEKTQLVDWVKAEFKLSDEVAERRVERGLALLLELADFALDEFVKPGASPEPLKTEAPEVPVV